jgi:hypothetical protein
VKIITARRVFSILFKYFSVREPDTDMPRAAGSRMSRADSNEFDEAAPGGLKDSAPKVLVGGERGMAESERFVVD